MKTLENFTYILTLIFLCILALVSVFYWHSFIATTICITGIVAWIKAIQHEEHN